MFSLPAVSFIGSAIQCILMEVRVFGDITNKLGQNLAK